MNIITSPRVTELKAPTEWPTCSNPPPLIIPSHDTQPIQSGDTCCRQQTVEPQKKKTPLVWQAGQV